MNSKGQLFIRYIALIALMATAVHSVHGATIWFGPTNTFIQFSPNATDQLTPHVALTRGGNKALYNTAPPSSEGFFDEFGVSPMDTMWAYGSITNPTINPSTYLNFQTMVALRSAAQPNFAGAILNQPMVVHLVSEDIYLSVTFTAWGQHGAGGFTYKRSTPPPAPPTPTVSITSPTNTASFIAPATFQINATATVASGSVTNVAFFANGNPLGSDQTAPFSIGSGGLAVGNYALTAIATAAGISSTSSVVNISVLALGSIILSSPTINAGQFSFDYTADVGQNYVIQNSSDFVSWVPLTTNAATTNLEHYSDSFIPGGSRSYRVGRIVP
jgi:hypothetical protein